MQSLLDYTRVDAGAGDDAPELPRITTNAVGAALLLVVAAFLGWAIAMTVLYADTQKGDGHDNTLRNNICNHVRDHAIIADDGCVYSSRAVLEAHEAILAYTGDWHFCGYWLVAGDWSLFTGGNSWSTWGTTADTNPLIAAFEQLNATVQHALSLSTTTFVEAAALEIELRELALLPELARLHHYHTGAFDWQWVNAISAPPTCVAFYSFFLPFFAAEQGYDNKSLTFMTNTLVAINQMNDYYPQAIDAGLLWFNDSAAQTWYFDWAVGATPGATQPICDAMTDATVKAACDALVPQIDAAFATLTDIMENQWIPACNDGFNYDHTGRAALPNGIDASYVWTNYYYGAESADTQREAVAAADAYSAQQLQALLNVYYPGTTVAQWNARNNDLNDADLWLCAPKIGPISDRTQLMWGNATRWSQQVMGYGSFDVPRPIFSVDSAAAASYSIGQWNSQQLLWTAPSTITYGVPIKPTMTGFDYCFLNYDYRLVDHEGVFGHARQLPLAVTAQCRGDPVPLLLSTTRAYIEGTAIYGERVAYQSTTMKTACPRCAMSTLLTTAYAGVGTMFDFAFFGNLTFSECIELALASGGYPTPAQAYNNCYRSMNSMQRATYYAPGRHLADLRTSAEAALGGAFDLIHWHKFIHRAGLLPWATLDELTDVYVRWRLGDETAADMRGYDYLVCQLFGNTWVTTFGAAHEPIYDDTLGSNPTTIDAVSPFDAVVASAESDESAAAALERLYAAKTMFITP